MVVNKSVLIAVFLILTQFLFTHISTASITDKMVQRKIIKDITWNYLKHEVYIEYIAILKKQNKEIRVYESGFTIKDEAFGNINLDKQKVINYLKSNENYSRNVYKSDIVFENHIEVFADLSNQNDVSKSELNKLINDAKKQVIHDFNNPPQSNSLKEFFQLNIVVNSSNWWVYLFIVTVIIFLITNRYK